MVFDFLEFGAQNFFEFILHDFCVALAALWLAKLEFACTCINCEHGLLRISLEARNVELVIAFSA